MKTMKPIYGLAIVDEEGNGILLQGEWTFEDAELEATAHGEEHGGKWHAIGCVTEEAS